MGQQVIFCLPPLPSSHPSVYDQCFVGVKIKLLLVADSCVTLCKSWYTTLTCNLLTSLGFKINHFAFVYCKKKYKIRNRKSHNLCPKIAYGNRRMLRALNPMDFVKDYLQISNSISVHLSYHFCCCCYFVVGGVCDYTI